MEYIHGGDIYTYEGLTDYSVNLNPFGPSDKVRRAVWKSIEEIDKYPDSRAGKLRKALSEKLGVPESVLIFGNGAAELIFLLVQADRPKRAIVTAPAFAEYRRALEAADCEVIEYPLREETCFALQEDYLSFLTEEVDMIFLCSPDNPSGCVIDRELLCNILKRCEEYKIRMVLDECFIDFLQEPEQQTMQGETDNHPMLFILRAFTKIYAIPGLRLGYGVTGDRLLLERMEEQRQPWSVSCMAQAAGLAAISEEERIRQTREYVCRERKWMEERLKEIGICFYPSEANFILLKSPYPLFEELQKKGFLIRDCSNYRGLKKGYYRIAVKNREDNERLMKALEEICSRSDRFVNLPHRP